MAYVKFRCPARSGHNSASRYVILFLRISTADRNCASACRAWWTTPGSPCRSDPRRVLARLPPPLPHLRHPDYVSKIAGARVSLPQRQRRHHLRADQCAQEHCFSSCFPPDDSRLLCLIRARIDAIRPHHIQVIAQPLRAFRGIQHAPHHLFITARRY